MSSRSVMLSESGEFCLKLIELTNDRDRFVEVGDFGERSHVLLDFTDDLWVVGSLTLEPGPDGDKLLARRVLMVMKNVGAFVEDPG